MKDPEDTRSVTPRIGTPLWTYVTAVSAAGLAVLAYALTQLAGVTALASHPLLWMMVALIAGGEIWPIITPGRTRQESATASTTMSLAVLLFWGYPLAITISVLAGVVIGAAQLRSAQRIMFNAAQMALSLAAAGLVLRLAGVTPSPAHPWALTGGALPAVLAAGLAYFAVNFCTVAIVLALSSRQPVVAVMHQNIGYQSITHAIMIPAAPLVAVVMDSKSAFLVALIGLPVAAMYANARGSVQREYQASHDDLTGLPNRTLLAKRTHAALVQAAGAGTGVGFLLLDLDRSSGLKEVNDTLGHAVGDKLLQIVARRLGKSVRPGDEVARLGGDEFAILLPSIREPTVAREVANRLRAALSEPVRLDAMTFYLEASVGIALYPDDATSFEQLMQRADVAMYQAKQQRSGIERYAAEADRNSPDKLALLGDLRGALDRSELTLYYQPKVLLSDHRVLGMEAKLRWHHPERGLLTGADFLGLARQSLLMREISSYVIEQALAQAAQWQAAGVSVPVAVGVPGRDLLYAGLAELISAGLTRHELPPDLFQIEFGEQVMASQIPYVTATADALAELGVELSLEHFGTGYASLTQLREFGVREVKLDRALISEIAEVPEAGLTVRSIVELARAMGIRTVAGGVNTAAIAAALREMGCEGAQGHYFAPPMPPAEATAWLASQAAIGAGPLPDVAGELAAASPTG